MIRTRIDPALTVTVRQTERQTVDVKPKGFWYSVDAGWEEWCKSEMPFRLDGKRIHAVTLGQERMLEIRTVGEIDAFHERYAEGPPDVRFLRYVNWPMVAEEYDGIEIAPYLWQRRLDGPAHGWYYGWDCASGCIWRPKGVSVVLQSSEKWQTK